MNPTGNDWDSPAAGRNNEQPKAIMGPPGADFHLQFLDYLLAKLPFQVEVIQTDKLSFLWWKPKGSDGGRGSGLD